MGAYFGLWDAPIQPGSDDEPRRLTGWRLRTFGAVQILTLGAIILGLGRPYALIPVSVAVGLFALLRAAPGQVIRRWSPAIRDALPAAIGGATSLFVFSGVRWSSVVLCASLWWVSIIVTVSALRRLEPPPVRSV